MLLLCSPSSFFFRSVGPAGNVRGAHLFSANQTHPISGQAVEHSLVLSHRRIEWLDHSPVLYTPVAIHSPCHLVRDRLVLRDSDHCTLRRSGLERA